MRRILIFVFAVVLSMVFFWGAARFLVVNSPMPSDTIIVLAGGSNESRVDKGLRLLQDGYGTQILFDENSDVYVFGFTRAQLAQEFVQHMSGDAAGKAHVCVIQGDSTLQETQYVGGCISQYGGGQKILLVTSDYHTRRALSTFTKVFPRYQWSVAAAEDAPKFGRNWWEHREWAKSTLIEWSKLLWWEVVDRWQTP